MATINALGLRGQPPAIPKPAGTLRVLAVGDSTTFGWGVGDDETYCATAQRLLTEANAGRSVEVVNAGVGAYNLRQDAAMLKRLAPALAPDIVLVGLFWNDLPYESVSPDSSAAGRPAAIPSGRGAKPFRIGNEPSRMNQIVRQSRVAYVLRHAWLKTVAPPRRPATRLAGRWRCSKASSRRRCRCGLERHRSRH
jgi:lysophospholipase L1-like esterase